MPRFTPRWFQHLTPPQMAELTTWFWLHEFGARLAQHVSFTLRSLRKWHDVRHWLRLLLLPISLIYSILDAPFGVAKMKANIKRDGITVYSHRNFIHLHSPRRPVDQ